MTPARAPVTGSDVDALFSGTFVEAAPTPADHGRARVYSPRYDRCAQCREMTAALITFSGDSDWSPGISETEPLRAHIDTLRAQLGKRNILLCTRCITDLRNTLGTDSAPVQPAHLFEL